jgi:diguanylate cyclase (GGDEF)-like protein
MSVLNNQVVIEPYSEKSSHNQDSYILNNAIHTTKSITLTYLENIISLEFSALHFSNPKKNLYAYQLEGFDKNWVHTDFKNRRASYTNLPAGEYNFKVKASNADGYWNEEGTSLKITVLPPPWKTWWAYSLYGIFLLSLVLRFIHYQRKKVIFERNLNAQLENKVVERTSQLQYKTEELQKSNTMLEKMSLTDQLTGLKNRRFLLNNIESDISLVLRKYKSSHDSMNTQKPEEADLIFFLIDLDHFKMVNDVYGHTAGDAVLIQIKVILKQVFREADYLVRWGGEEFLVIARFTERNNAPELAERLRQAVESHDFDIGDEKILKKTCSIGFACYPFSTGENEALSWEQVVDVADHCMYAAKKSSRNAWVGLYNENTEIGDSDLFTMVIEQTQSLIQTDELKILSSIIDVDQVNW